MGLKGEFQLIQILGLLGMYLNATVVFVTNNSLLFRLALAILFIIKRFLYSRVYNILSLVQYFNFPTLMLVVCWAKRSSDGARFENHANFSLADAGPRAKTGNIWQWTFTLIFGQSSISLEMLFIHVSRSVPNRFHNFFLCFLYW